MDGDLIEIPTIVTTVPQDFFVEPLNSPTAAGYQLKRFPDSLYNKSPNSVLVKFLYSLLGITGMGYVQNGYVKARLMLEDSGMEGFDLDAFYGDPMKFPRVLDEGYEDVGNLTTIPGWKEIEAQDAKYRARAADYVRGAQMGGTVNGLTLVAKSGLGNRVQLIERYKALFDQNSDLPLGLIDYGNTRSVNELVVQPILTEDQYVADNDINKIEYDRRTMRSALDRIRPVDVIVSFEGADQGGRVNSWSKVYSTSEFVQTSQFVTGSSSIVWPAKDEVNWIQGNVEVEAPETRRLHNYEFWHQVLRITASSTHVGVFSKEQQDLFPQLRVFKYDDEIFDASKALAPKGSLLRATDVIVPTNTDIPKTLLNDIYPDTYLNLVGSTPDEMLFWASSVGDALDEDWIDLDLGEVRAVNFVSFEVLNKPILIEVHFDNLDSDDGTRNFVRAVESGPIKQLQINPQRASVWEHVMLDLFDESGSTIFTRFIRLKLVRKNSEDLKEPWNVEMRGLRVGRVS